MKFYSFAGYIFLIFLSSCTVPLVQNNKTEKKFFKTDIQFPNEGKHVTSSGELRTLIVYIDFKDNDTLNSPSWQWNKNVLPVWANSIVNKTTELSFSEANLTDYFYKMSQGKFFLYGDVYPKVVIPLQEQSKYKSIKEVNDEVIKRIDSEVDFSQYDNWSKNKNGKYVNEPDGKVDVLFLVYRDFKDRLFFNNGWTGIAHLYLTNNYTTNDGVEIATGRLDKGSGIQIRAGKHGFNYIKYILAHEFGHLLFGAGHIENVTNLALMTGGPVWNASRGMHSWERNKLKWLNYIDVPTTKNSTYQINDYLTTGEVLRIKLSNKEWFIIENHQKLSSHDWAGDKGIYIYKVKSATSSFPIITVECADGNWNFEIDETNQKLIKTVPNPAGKTEMNFRRRIKKQDYSCNKQVYGDKSAWGDEFDAFDLTYNNLFSPVSNPPSKNNSKKDLAILVKEQENNKYKIDILFNDIYEFTPPTKPQIVGVEQIGTKKILLKWLQNKEPDLLRYNIYNSFQQKNNLRSFKQIKGNTNDKTAEVNLFSLLKDKKTKLSIAITAFDKSGKESVMSDFIELLYNSKTKKWDWQRIEEY